MTLKELLKVIEIDTSVQIEDLQEMHTYCFDMTIEIPKEYHSMEVKHVGIYHNKLNIWIY